MDLDGNPISTADGPLEKVRDPKSRVNEAPLEDPGALELTGAPDQKPMAPRARGVP